MNKCMHGVYVTEKMSVDLYIVDGVAGLASDCCSICKCLFPELDYRYGRTEIYEADLPRTLKGLYELWTSVGSEIAYEKLFFAIQRYARTIARSKFFGEDIPDWRDAADDAGTDCIRDIKQYKGDSGGFSTWATKCIDHALTKWVTRDIEKDDISINDEENPIEIMDRRAGIEEKVFLKEVKSLLSPEELNLFELKAIGLTYEEIGSELDVSHGTAFNRWTALEEKIRLMGTVVD